MSFISHCYNDRKESLLTLLHLVSILLDYELPRYPIIAIDGSDDIRSFGKTHQTALIQMVPSKASNTVPLNPTI